MRNRWKIALTVNIGLPALAGIWLTSLHYQNTSRLEAYKQQLRAQGEKLDVSELVPPPPKPEDNGADTLKQAFSLYGGGIEYHLIHLMPWNQRMIAPGRAMVQAGQPEVRNFDSTNTWESAQAAVAAAEPAFALMRQAAAYPVIDFQLDYRQGYNLMLPQLPALKRCAQGLSAAATCELQAGHPAAAVTNLCAVLGLVQGETGERILISQLVRMAMAQIAVAANWEVLQATNLTDAELAKLQTAWAGLEFRQAMQNTLEMERAIAGLSFKKMRSSNAEAYNMLGFTGAGSSGSAASLDDWLNHPGEQLKDTWDATKLKGTVVLWRSSWSYDDELRDLKYDQMALSLLRAEVTNPALHSVVTNLTQRTAAWQAANPNAGSGPVWRTLGLDEARQMIASLFNVPEGTTATMLTRLMTVEVARQTVITAIALKRFQLTQGHWPQRLEELVPDYLAAVPLDPVDGQPLRYRCNADGTFLLYSVGSDGVDDGGDPTMPKSAGSTYWLNLDARDWVWPQPATAAEVEKFYQEPANP